MSKGGKGKSTDGRAMLAAIGPSFADDRFDPIADPGRNDIHVEILIMFFELSSAFGVQ